ESVPLISTLKEWLPSVPAANTPAANGTIILRRITFINRKPLKPASYWPMNDVEPVVVRTFLNKIEAEIAQGALKAANIESMVSADDAGGTRPGLWMSGVRLLVRAVDAERATAILRESGKKARSSQKKIGTKRHK